MTAMQSDLVMLKLAHYGAGKLAPEGSTKDRIKDTLEGMEFDAKKQYRPFKPYSIIDNNPYDSGYDRRGIT